LSDHTIRDVFSFQPGTIFSIVCNGIPFKLDADIAIRSFRVLPGMRDKRTFEIHVLHNDTAQFEDVSDNASTLSSSITGPPVISDTMNELKYVKFIHIKTICCNCQEKIDCEWKQCVGCKLFGAYVSSRIENPSYSYLCIIYKHSDTNLIKCMAEENRKTFKYDTLWQTCTCYKIDFIEKSGLLYALETGKTMRCLTLKDKEHKDKTLGSHQLQEMQTLNKNTLKIIPLRPEKNVEMCNIL
jgi:hypothetical protein